MTEWAAADWARYYVDQGLTVLPLAPRTNQPHRLNGKGWHFCACTGGEPVVGSADPAEAAGWFARDPRANLGVVTGARSRLLVLDVDVKHVDGHAALRAWRQERTGEGLELPAHPSASTPSGGRHHWFRLPAGLHVPRNDHFLPGVEVKACGGLVAVPPSVRLRTITVRDVDGDVYDDEERRSYAWDPVVAPIPEAPAWLLADVAARREGAAWLNGAAGDGATGDDDKLPPTGWFVENGFCREGSRNRDVFRLAFRLWSRGLDEAEVVGTVREAWSAAGTDRASFPWSEAHYTTLTARGRADKAAEAERETLQRYAAAARTLRQRAARPRRGGAG